MACNVIVAALWATRPKTAESKRSRTQQHVLNACGNGITVFLILKCGFAWSRTDDHDDRRAQVFGARFGYFHF
jgi:hypothetical protein